MDKIVPADGETERRDGGGPEEPEDHSRPAAGSSIVELAVRRPPVYVNIHTSNNHGLMALFARIYSKCTGARRSMGIYTHTDR